MKELFRIVVRNNGEYEFTQSDVDIFNTLAPQDYYTSYGDALEFGKKCLDAMENAECFEVIKEYHRD